jgi:hypothetical protein
MPTKGHGAVQVWRPCPPAMAAGRTEHVGALRAVRCDRGPLWPQPQRVSATGPVAERGGTRLTGAQRQARRVGGGRENTGQGLMTGRCTPRRRLARGCHYYPQPTGMRPLIAPALHEDGTPVSVLVDSPPQGMTLALDRPAPLVHVPLVPWRGASGRQRRRVCLPQWATPLAEGLVGHRDAALAPERMHGPGAQREARRAPDALADHLAGAGVVLRACRGSGWVLAAAAPGGGVISERSSPRS